ncbi:DEAD/DEAH box helicase, partial [uncultured Abyssibacter sp.]|uniref:DEAD/DEAH box helicase n=1 Tax=uncultured Abyssibacter sp. TaxID=2320202 RepID=UPI0032B2C7CE
MMDVFNFRNRLVGEYESFSRSFSLIRSGDIQSIVESEYQNGRYWPAPLLQINPHYQPAKTVQELAADGTLHPKCGEIFRVGKDLDTAGEPLRLYKHQIEAISLAAGGSSYVVTTGTGSGKSLAFFIPIIDRVLRAKDKDPNRKTRAIVIYPMNALANSQREELKKFLGDVEGGASISVARYTGDESEEARKRIAANPPDILLTNFMMLELILTRFEEVDRAVIDNCRGLEFLVLDELHTYRGRQGADVALLVRRLRQRTQSQNLICVGTSATMASEGRESDRNQVVAGVASRLFGQEV